MCANFKQAAYRESSFQFSCCDREAVEHHILADTVDPLASWRQRGTDEISALSLTAGETTYNLKENCMFGIRYMWKQSMI